MKFKLYDFFIHDEDSRDYLANYEYTKEILFFDDEHELKEFEIYLRENMEEYEKCVKGVKADTQRKTIPKIQGHDYQDEYDHRLALKKFCEIFFKSKTMKF